MSSTNSVPAPPSTSEAENETYTYNYEQAHVHDVYNKIASHFSETRYKPWPIVDSFLRALTPGSIGLDIGCGNGKYLAVRNDIYVLASDRSDELVKIAARHEPHSAIVADTLTLPHAEGVFDFAICIAVVHHLSTRGRRVEAVGHILGQLRPPEKELLEVGGVPSQSDSSKAGEALFFVWALEQKNSRRGWDEGHEQDVLVPWVLKPNHNNSTKSSGASATPMPTPTSIPIPTLDSMEAEAKSNRRGKDECDNPDLDTQHRQPTTYQRYYHLYRRGELEEDIIAAGGEVVRSGYDRDNWWCVARRKPGV